MIGRVETRLDGTTLVVRIPMRFQRRGGRKRIVAPDGSAIVPSPKPQPDGTLVKALARAWRWQRMLDEGVYASVSEIGVCAGAGTGVKREVASAASARRAARIGSEIHPGRKGDTTTIAALAT